MKRRWLNLGVAAVMALAVVLQPMTAHALEKDGETWDDLCGESTINSTVIGQDGNRLWTTIQTNYHAGGITGLVVRTPESEIDKILNITSDDKWYGQKGVLYVGRAPSTAQDVEKMQEYAATLGGKAIYDYQINLFKWTGTWNEPVETTSSPIRMTVGISRGDEETGYSYAMLHLVDGQGEFLYDLDDYNFTLTFDVTDFRGAYVFVKYPSANKPANTGTQPSAPANNNTDDYDEVPKMGDKHTMMLSVIFTGSVLLGAVAFIYRKKMA